MWVLRFQPATRRHHAGSCCHCQALTSPLVDKSRNHLLLCTSRRSRCLYPTDIRSDTHLYQWSRYCVWTCSCQEMASDAQSNPWRHRTFLDRTATAVWLAPALPDCHSGIVVRIHCTNHETRKPGETHLRGISLLKTVVSLSRRHRTCTSLIQDNS